MSRLNFVIFYFNRYTHNSKVEIREIPIRLIEMTSCGENIRIVKFRTLTKIEAGTFKGDGMKKSGLTVFVAAASFVFVIRSQRVVGVA